MTNEEAICLIGNIQFKEVRNGFFLFGKYIKII